MGGTTTKVFLLLVVLMEAVARLDGAPIDGKRWDGKEEIESGGGGLHSEVTDGPGRWAPPISVTPNRNGRGPSWAGDARRKAVALRARA
ncbi:hypothetical protein E2562_012836 [Oryza meyeriana var. granulata]|uniref:Secreted protein n=1 Tax=Oryza meyeriana var. granulata TaxID=110450 RepID=A0A6G1CQF3_9ORYZ|nr:hypothetical protein E2562_012836 [Oryza meyeriana var. granulata]